MAGDKRPERVVKSSILHVRVTDKMHESIYRLSVIRDESSGQLVRRAVQRELARIESSDD